MTGNPYQRAPDQVGPYSNTSTGNERDKRDDRSNADQHDNAQPQTNLEKSVASAMLRDTKQVVVQSTQSVTSGSSATGGSVQAASTSVNAASAASAQISGLGAATAQVSGIVNAIVAANAVAAPIASAITGAMVAVGPFAVLAVLGAYGITK